MPFSPLRLGIVYDNTRGHCGRVVPRMVKLLEERAFIVDARELGRTPIDIGPYAGLILGTPVFGLGWRGVGPTPALRHFIETCDGLAGMPVAIFCAYEIRPGNTFDRMKNVLFDKGAELVAEHAFWVGRPERGEHVIPAECMVRIR